MCTHLGLVAVSGQLCAYAYFCACHFIAEFIHFKFVIGELLVHVCHTNKRVHCSINWIAKLVDARFSCWFLYLIGICWYDDYPWIWVHKISFNNNKYPIYSMYDFGAGQTITSYYYIGLRFSNYVLIIRIVNTSNLILYSPDL